MSNKASLTGQMQVEGFDTFTRAAFHKPAMRKAMRRSGNVVAKEAKKLLSIKGRSSDDDYPGLGTGRLRRSVRVKVSRPGFLVKVYNEKLADMDAFYPAYLHYGTSKGLKARKNNMTDALDNRESEVRRILSNGLMEALR